MQRIPVTVIGGYLGAGKTTLINHLLRRADGLRLAVLVNDFGDLSIDEALIESREGGVIGIAGGCICCSIGSDLVDALDTLARRDPPPDHVLIETSGVALPGPVASTVALLPGFVLDCVTVLADAGAVRALAADRYLADTIQRQLVEAQIILLNKLDRLPDSDRPALDCWLAEASPRARIVPVERGAVEPALVIGARLGFQAVPVLKPPPRAAGLYATHVLAAEAPVDVAALARMLAEPSLGVLRAKGVLVGSDGGLRMLQCVGGDGMVEDAPQGWTRPCGLVVIGLKSRLDIDAVQGAMRSVAIKGEGA